MRGSWRTVAPAAGLCLFTLALTTVAYLPSLDAGFYFDDLPNLVEVPALHWTSLPADPAERLTQTGINSRRVVANLTFGLNHLAGGLDPRGYHRVNLLIHLAVGAALTWVAVLLVREPTQRMPRREEGPDGALPAAIAATTLFLVHPLATQAVTYVVQRMTSLATLFTLLALGAWIRGRRAGGPGARAGWFAAAAAAGVLAVGSKETGLLLPLLVATWEVCFRRETWRRRWRAFAAAPRRLHLRVAAALLAAGLLAAVALASYAGGTRLSLTEPFPNRDFNGLERVLTQGRVQLFYLGLFLWPAPSRLNLDHEFEISRGLLEPPATLPAVVLWVAAAAGAVRLAGRRPRFGFPLLLYLELHLLESGPLNLEMVFEHRMYAPMAVLALLPALVLADLPPRARRAGIAAALLLALPLAVATRARNLTWADPIAFHRDCAEKAPGKFRPWYNLGTVLGQAGRAAEAVPALERAVALEPEHSEARNQLANAFLLTGRPEEALTHYREAVRLDPANVEALFNLAVLLDRRGEAGEAETFYRRFLTLAPPRLAPQAEQVRRRLGESPGRRP